MSLIIKNRHNLKSKEIKFFQNQLKNFYDDIFIDKKSSVEIGEMEDLVLIFVDNKPSFIFYKDKILFTLFGLNKFKPKKKFVIVDMGAVRFISNGADVMTPGIVDADKGITENDPVWVCDEKYHKPLATGIAVINREEMINKNKGKAIKIIHYVGDNLWNFFIKK
ncbi:MAG: RNA-binding protein [Candidatus Thermoplasmatota archaeon]|jgi:PUA domain protein|nr:RNA-binding protein [Candidatus Thermoplasmatota archaeon]